MAKAGQALKQVLETYGISQNRLAVTMGVRRSNVNRWVNEETDPAADAVLEIRMDLRRLIQMRRKNLSAVFGTMTCND
jgi:plasmid maintenance system antidote protein VapI